jgi:hypothetical protein
MEISLEDKLHALDHYIAVVATKNHWHTPIMRRAIIRRGEIISQMSKIEKYDAAVLWHDHWASNGCKDSKCEFCKNDWTDDEF